MKYKVNHINKFDTRYLHTGADPTRPAEARAAPDAAGSRFGRWGL